MKLPIAQEAELIEHVLTFRDRPLDFAMFIYPWGEAGTPFETFLAPRPWQLEELSALQDHLLECAEMRAAGLEPSVMYKAGYSSGRGPGKSALFGMVAHWHASTHFGAPTIVAANSESQMRMRTFPEFARWFGGSLNAHWWNLEGLSITPQPWLAEGVGKTKQEGGLQIDPMYWYVKGQMWTAENPSGFRGAHNMYGMLTLFDEADGIPHDIWTNTYGFFTDPSPYRVWMAASQMQQNKGAFYDLFYDEKFGKGWRTRTLNTEGMAGVDQREVQDLIERYGSDSDQVRVQVRGLPPRTAEDQFIPADYIRLAMGNSLFQDYGEALVMGVDPAPRGRTTIRFRQGRNARDCVGRDTAIVLEGYDHVQLAEYIVQLDHKYKPQVICIDFGYGTGIIDILKRKHLHARLEIVKSGDMAMDKKGEFGSRGAELWGKLRDWLPGGMIPTDDGTKGTLSHQLLNRGWAWSGREDGKKIMEKKADMKVRGVMSPDDADALAYTLAVNPPRLDKIRTIARRVEGAEDNPYGW